MQNQPVLALVDTGARYGIFPADLAGALGYSAEGQAVSTRISTRLGDYDGHLLRIPITIPATEGTGLDMELTWFVCPGWPGPPVIGWSNCLERIRFCLDPRVGEECFYFADTAV